jgi:hypothetical protein
LRASRSARRGHEPTHSASPPSQTSLHSIRGHVPSLPVPRSPGVYAWYFDVPPPLIDIKACHRIEGRALLYVGISPRAPSRNGLHPNRSTLRKRIQTHYGGNAEGSTLRRTLGCLLGSRLHIRLRRVGSLERLTIVVVTTGHLEVSPGCSRSAAGRLTRIDSGSFLYWT